MNGFWLSVFDLPFVFDWWVVGLNCCLWFYCSLLVDWFERYLSFDFEVLTLGLIGIRRFCLVLILLLFWFGLFVGYWLVFIWVYVYYLIELVGCFWCVGGEFVCCFVVCVFLFVVLITLLLGFVFICFLDLFFVLWLCWLMFCDFEFVKIILLCCFVGWTFGLVWTCCWVVWFGLIALGCLVLVFVYFYLSFCGLFCLWCWLAGGICDVFECLWCLLLCFWC